MKINQHVAPRRLTTHLVVEVHHRLIVTLHEVNLQPFHTPLFSLVEGGFELIVKRLPDHPQDDADIFLFAVSD